MPLQTLLRPSAQSRACPANAVAVVPALVSTWTTLTTTALRARAYVVRAIQCNRRPVGGAAASGPALIRPTPMMLQPLVATGDVAVSFTAEAAVQRSATKPSPSTRPLGETGCLKAEGRHAMDDEGCCFPMFGHAVSVPLARWASTSFIRPR